MKKYLLIILLFSIVIQSQTKDWFYYRSINRGLDTIPSQFTFTDVTGYPLSTADTSNGVALAGFDSAYAYAGGAYFRDGLNGSWGTAYKIVHLDDTCWVKNNSSSSYSTAVNTTLTVGGVSDIYTITTLAWTPNLVGILTGNSLSDFSYRTKEGNNTVSIDAGRYKTYYDSAVAYNEDAYFRKTFTPNSDSIFVEAKVTLPETITSYAVGDEHVFLTIEDTVAGVYVASIGTDDANSDRIADRWYIRYKDATSNTEGYSITAFVLGTTTTFRIKWKDGGLTNNGLLQVYAGSELIFDLSAKNFTSYTPNAITIGNTSLVNVNDYAVFSTWYFDDIYVDSRGFYP